MYIKINKRLSSATGIWNRRVGDTNLQFSVIESYREGGKVKHRTLSYLATIPDTELRNVSRLESFWKNCDEKLSAFPAADRTRLAARVETIVPRPSEEMAEQVRKELLQQRKEFAEYLLSRHTSTSPAQ
jgi:hypothetical protein